MLTQTKFCRLFSRLWKRILIFQMKQLYNFFQFRWHEFKLFFARRRYMFKLFTYVTTLLFKKNQCFFVIQSKYCIRRKIKHTWLVFEKNLSLKRDWHEKFWKNDDVRNRDSTLLLLIYFIDDSFWFIDFVREPYGSP